MSGNTHWQRLIPVAFISYSLAYVDHANYSIGSAAGLAHDLGITPDSPRRCRAMSRAGRSH